MNDFFTRKQKNKNDPFDALERDVPFDVAHEWGESRFAQFYLEQTNQQSNIYFEQYQQEQAAQEPFMQHRDIAPPAFSRFSFLRGLAGAGAFGVVALGVVLGAAWWWGGGAQAIPVFADARAAYEDVLAAQESFARFDLEQAMFAFHAAHERATQRAQGVRVLAAYAQDALAFLVRRGDGEAYTDVPTLEQKALGAAEKLAQGMEPLFQVSFPSLFRVKSGYAGTATGELIGDALLGIREAVAALRETQETFAELKNEPALSDDARGQVAVLAPQLSLASAHAQQLASYLKLAVWALGAERPKKFLLVAQDSTVARPTGGAIRSVGVITTQGGAITDIVFDDVYGVDGQLQVNVVPPEPIQKSATAWALHDANWFLDFPMSAKKIAYFYQKSGGIEVDGVIAINEQVVKKILVLTGPVKGAGGVLVNSESSQGLVHVNVVRALAEVLPTFSGDDVRALVQTIQEGLHEKDILLWLAERDHQEMITQEGWSGGVINEPGADYLAVVSSDIYDGTEVVREDIWKETNIAESGDAVNTVAVQFIPQENSAGAKHERYVRIYVPAGSELLETSGFSATTITPQIDYFKERFTADEDLVRAERVVHEDASGVRVFEESGKTVFGGWVTIGEKNATAIIRYRLPPSLADGAPIAPMTFIFQKQPGVFAKVNFSLAVPEGMRATDTEGNDLAAFSADGKSDVIIRAIIK